MILLRLISWPYARKHLLRCFLTIIGIVLGVAVFVGMHTANQSVLYAFNATVDRIAGKTELELMHEHGLTFAHEGGCFRGDVDAIEVTAVHPHAAYVRMYVVVTARARLSMPCPTPAPSVAPIGG